MHLIFLPVAANPKIGEARLTPRVADCRRSDALLGGKNHLTTWQPASSCFVLEVRMVQVNCELLCFVSCSKGEMGTLHRLPSQESTWKEAPRRPCAKKNQKKHRCRNYTSEKNRRISRYLRKSMSRAVWPSTCSMVSLWDLHDYLLGLPFKLFVVKTSGNCLFSSGYQHTHTWLSIWYLI